jgi:hypothetical protein
LILLEQVLFFSENYEKHINEVWENGELCQSDATYGNGCVASG